MILAKLTMLLYLITPVWAESVRTIHLCENTVAVVPISPKGTELDFPSEPQKVMLLTKSSFSVEYIRNDLALAPSTLTSTSHLFVYIEGRRFGFDLVTRAGSPALYFIKDCETDLRPQDSKPWKKLKAKSKS